MGGRTPSSLAYGLGRWHHPASNRTCGQEEGQVAAASEDEPAFRPGDDLVGLQLTENSDRVVVPEELAVDVQATCLYSS